VARTFGTHFVITANATDDGAPVYLRPDRTWTRLLPEALATDDEVVRDELLALAGQQQRQICDPYAFKVELADGQPVATTARERIRAQGPTTPLRRPDTSSPRLTG
jgi:hypothetical protein